MMKGFIILTHAVSSPARILLPVRTIEAVAELTPAEIEETKNRVDVKDCKTSVWVHARPDKLVEYFVKESFDEIQKLIAEAAE